MLYRSVLMHFRSKKTAESLLSVVARSPGTGGKKSFCLDRCALSGAHRLSFIGKEVYEGHGDYLSGLCRGYMMAKGIRC
jgi:hypothetical protein